MINLTTCALFGFYLSLATTTGDRGLTVDVETYTLPNGMRVALYEDHSLPKVVINTWFSVGSKDEVEGRTGFAHLFEHLMFMGTGRVPGSQFDVIMESGGGFNNATTSQDRTNYYSQGPSSLLPTLMWLDADRFEALADHMTVDKLDSQRGVVRNERRQTGENVPYGRADLMLPELLYPEGHPYRHSVIGSHADLEAAELDDVTGFFRTYYVPGNASLVVAGDFDRAEVKRLVARTMGALEPKRVPKHTSASPVSLASEIRAVTFDDVELPKLILVWHSPAYMTPGDGAMDVLASILAGGSATRLEQRLVNETGLAQEVVAYQGSAGLGSTFHIEVTGAAGADLDSVKAEVLSVIKAFVTPGHEVDREAELARVQAQLERSFLQRGEDLLARADSINRYLHYWGVADGFQRDLERWTRLSAEDVRIWAARVLGEGRVDLRVLPSPDEQKLGQLVMLSDDGARPRGRRVASLDQRPENFEDHIFVPPTPGSYVLSNGIRAVLHPTPGTQLFSGALLFPGGESLVPEASAGLSSLTARLLTEGAGGKDTARWAQAVESLGGTISASAERGQLSISVSGLTSKLDETLDYFAEAALEPNLRAADFEREKGLALGDIHRRADNPRAVAGLASRALLFGPGNYRGRPVDGYVDTVESLELTDVVGAYSSLIAAEGASFIFVGDFDAPRLLKSLEARFGQLDSRVAKHAGAMNPRELARAHPTPPLERAGPGRTVLIDRPGAQQTVIYILRPLSLANSGELALRTCLNTAMGGSFTSRLNMNLRERNHYSYGAGSRINREGDQVIMLASSSVQTDVTGKALTEFKREFEALSGGDVSREELAKAIESSRTNLMEDFGTTRAIAATFSELVANGRDIDAKRSELAALEFVDLEALNQLARGGLYDWSKLQIVMVGDASRVLPQLTEAGFSPPLTADTEGRLRD